MIRWRRLRRGNPHEITHPPWMRHECHIPEDCLSAHGESRSSSSNDQLACATSSSEGVATAIRTEVSCSLARALSSERRESRGHFQCSARSAHRWIVIPPLEQTCLEPEAPSTSCVQNLDDSLDSAIHTTYHISLRPSSFREPRYPSAGIVLFDESRRKTPSHQPPNGTPTRRETTPCECRQLQTRACKNTHALGLPSFRRKSADAPLPESGVSTIEMAPSVGRREDSQPVTRTRDRPLHPSSLKCR